MSGIHHIPFSSAKGLFILFPRHHNEERAVRYDVLPVTDHFFPLITHLIVRKTHEHIKEKDNERPAVCSCIGQFFRNHLLYSKEDIPTRKGKIMKCLHYVAPVKRTEDGRERVIICPP